MSKKIKQPGCKAMIVLTLFFALALSIQAYAQEEENWKKAHQERFNSIAQELKLSPQQQAQLAEQRKKQKEESMVLQQKIRTVRERLRQELENNSTNKEKIYALTKEMKELLGKRIDQKIEGVILMKETLTPQQFKALNEKSGIRGSLKGVKHEKGLAREGTYGKNMRNFNRRNISNRGECSGFRQ